MISLPIVFGEGQGQRVEEAFRGEWQLSTVEMVKRNAEWYAHFVLTKNVELADEPETVIAVDRGERNLAAAVAISKNNPKPMKGQFWRGKKSKELEGFTTTSEESFRGRKGLRLRSLRVKKGEKSASNCIS